VVLSLLDLTALTTLSQRWNTYVWLVGVVVAVVMPQHQQAVVALVVC
jgi:hypothetical protein